MSNEREPRYKLLLLDFRDLLKMITNPKARIDKLEIGDRISVPGFNLPLDAIGVAAEHDISRHGFMIKVWSAEYPIVGKHEVLEIIAPEPIWAEFISVNQQHGVPCRWSCRQSTVCTF